MNDPQRAADLAEQVKLWREFADKHTYHLNRLIAEAATEGLKFLGLLNLGGVAATLGFIGATRSHSPWLLAAFAAFMIANVSTAIAYLLRYLTLDSHFQSFQRALEKGWKGAGPVDMAAAIADWNQEIRRGPDWSVVCAVGALALFVIGTVFGAIGVSCY
ncbi:hypothetical protein M3I53_00995 [Paraburkholderia sp. CNPSo 3272]|uniref:hypothetical protein n=1 Tax=Paraburkholderia sp. CNPSo 3272 TaxID=2940931 RepID=UPI0020B75AE1|nr:hypothetical protein [Paraburkholderia sp. CNPSo 3272]MCP3721713.1 hypothetical protein [Paraburkholderia sp. CNPSo 3272]